MGDELEPEFDALPEDVRLEILSQLTPAEAIRAAVGPGSKRKELEEKKLELKDWN